MCEKLIQAESQQINAYGEFGSINEIITCTINTH